MTANDDPDRTLSIRGTPVPRLGFGTWQITGDHCVDAVVDALGVGYRHIDTARAYGNERQVGEALRAAGIPREEIFLATKVWMDDLEPALLRRSAEASLRHMATDYLDLLMIHWPNPGVPLERSLEAMTELRDRGLIRELGVSNFPPGLLRRALEIAPVFCNQIEYHPFLGQEEMLSIAAEHDVLITAYAPLAHGRVFGDATLEAIASEHGTGVAQVALRWLIDQPKISAIPKASSRRNRIANFGVWDLELSPQERRRIDALPKDRRHSDPHWAPDWDA